MSLQELRNKIDVIDDKIAALYAERMEVCKAVGEEKAKNNSPAENGGREKEILNRVTKAMPDEIKLFGKQLFTTLFDTSKAYQRRFIGLNGAISPNLAAAVEKRTAFPINATVACQGAAGSFSSFAAEKVFALSDILYVKEFENVFEAVEKGLCEFGVLPIENSYAGSVNAVYDLMMKHRFFIIRSVKLRVSHNLLVNSGATIEGIREIFSHEQAIAQCKNFLSGLKNVKITICENTAVAARMVAESGRKDAAAIASGNCAAEYGLVSTLANIQDSGNNYTRFIVISKDLRIYEGADKISIIVVLPHEAGSLNKMLNTFSTLGLNLTKLESRPLKDTSFEFCFYFDFNADITRKDVQALLAETELAAAQFVFLGSYTET